MTTYLTFYNYINYVNLTLMRLWNRKFTKIAALPLLFFGVVLFGIFLSSNQWTQDVVIKVIKNGEPVTSLKLKFIEGEKNKDCSSDGVSGTTDNNGLFRFNRIRQSSLIEIIAVVVQHDILCIEDSHEWKIIWSTPYGPAPKQLNIQCDLDQEAAVNANGVIYGPCKVAPIK